LVGGHGCRIARCLQHEYERAGCGHHFEHLTRAEQSPTCPSCRGENPQKLLSVFAAHSDSPAKSFPSSPLEPWIVR
jgi:putative FmdB family regulatory protein